MEHGPWRTLAVENWQLAPLFCLEPQSGLMHCVSKVSSVVVGGGVVAGPKVQVQVYLPPLKMPFS